MDERRALHRQLWLVLGTAILWTGLIYGPPAWSAGYVHDDHPALLSHPLVRWPPPVAEIFASPWLGPRALFPNQGVSRPLVTLGYCVEAGLGLGARGRHLVNLALFASTAALLGWLLFILLRARPMAERRVSSLLAVALFAAYPLHASSAMNIGSRPEVQAATLALLATLSFVAAVRGRRLAGPLAVALLMAALWSKESAMTVLAPWLVWGSLQGRGRKRAWTWVGVAALLCGGWMLLRLSWLGSPVVASHDNPLVDGDLSGRLIGALWLISHAAGKLLWPMHLAPDETFDALPVRDPDLLGVAIGGALLLGLFVLAIWDLWRAERSRIAWKGERHEGGAGERRGPNDRSGELATAIAWTGGAWLPVSNLLFLSTVLYADRLLFLPSLGLLGLIAVALGPALLHPETRWRRLGAWTIVFGLTLPWGAKAQAEAWHWCSDEALFSHGVEAQPRSLRMRYDLGRLMLNQGKLEEAAEHLEAARSLDARDIQSLVLLLQVRTRQGDCGRCETLIVAMENLTKQHRISNGHQDAVYKASVDADVRCHRFSRAFSAGRALHHPNSEWAHKVYVAGVAAEAPEAEAWARRFSASPRESPGWVAAAVYAEQQAGRPLAALARLRHLHERRPQIDGPMTMARQLCAQAPPSRDTPKLKSACAHWPGPENKPRQDEVPPKQTRETE